MFDFVLSNKGAIGIALTSTWSVLASTDPSIMPPGQNLTITGLLLTAIIVLWREIKASREETKAERIKTEEANEKIVLLLQNIVKKSNVSSDDQFRDLREILKIKQ